MPLTGFTGFGWKLIERGYLPANATTITISGLNGDEDELYHFIAMIRNASGGSCYYQLRPNGITITQISQVLVGYNTGASSAQRAEPPFSLGGVTVGEYAIYDLLINAKTGRERVGSCRFSRSYPVIGVIGSRWGDTTTNITSLVLTAEQTNGLGAGTFYALFKMVV